MSCYLLLLDRSPQTAPLHVAPDGPEVEARLVAFEYCERVALELWQEPWRDPGLVAVNDPASDDSGT